MIGENEFSISRRSIISGIMAAGLGSSTIPLGSQQAYAKEGDVTMLGDFESGRDDWSTNGRNKLSIVTAEQRPAGVTKGQQALEVEVTGDSYPLIENNKQVQKADFINHPYLIADVAPGLVSDTDSNITFKFRLHHSNGESENGSAQKGTQTEKSALVEESDEITVRPAVPSRLYWDMSEISSNKLEAAQRLEITWYPTKHPPKSGGRGQGQGFDYRGTVTFDNIRLSDRIDEASNAQISQKMLNMEFEFGIFTEKMVDTYSDDLEEGKFVFKDGTQVAYSFEVLDEDKYRYVIDGEEFKLGGEW